MNVPEPQSEFIGDVLRSLIARWADYEIVPEKELARRLGVSPASYSNYKDGKRVPPYAKAEMIARHWVKYTKENEDLIEEIARRLAGARLHKAVSFMPGLMGEGVEVRVSKLNLGIFGEFFHRVFERYAREAGIRIQHGEMSSPGRLRAELKTGKTHVALSVFDSINRSLWARFLPMLPIRLSLSAVGLFPATSGPTGLQIVNLADAIARGEGPSSGKYLPLVVAGGVGEQHCRNTLRLSPTEMEIERTLDPAKLAARLRMMKEESESPDGTKGRPVFIGDEYTCIRVLNELKREGCLLFPLSTRQNLRHIPLCQELPRYRVSVGISRTNEKLFEFMRDSFTTFMSREFHLVANSIAKLCTELEAEVRAATPYMSRWVLDSGDRSSTWLPTTALEKCEGNRLATEYCRHVFHLDIGSIKNATDEVEPWVPLLYRVREIVLTAQARDKIVCYDAASNQRDTDAKVKALLLQLAAKYRSMRELESVADIEKDREDLSVRYGGAAGRVILVSEGSEGGQAKIYTGMLCVTRVNHLSGNTDETIAQLRYLWVNPMYQGECLGKVLIQEAVRYAAINLKASIVCVEVIPALQHAIDLFRDEGFKAGSHTPQYSNRLMFELPVSSTHIRDKASES